MLSDLQYLLPNQGEESNDWFTRLIEANWPNEGPLSIGNAIQLLIQHGNPKEQHSNVIHYLWQLVDTASPEKSSLALEKLQEHFQVSNKDEVRDTLFNLIHRSLTQGNLSYRELQSLNEIVSYHLMNYAAAGKVTDKVESEIRKKLSEFISLSFNATSRERYQQFILFLNQNSKIKYCLKNSVGNYMFKLPSRGTKRKPTDLAAIQEIVDNAVLEYMRYNIGSSSGSGFLKIIKFGFHSLDGQINAINCLNDIKNADTALCAWVRLGFYLTREDGSWDNPTSFKPLLLSKLNAAFGRPQSTARSFGEDLCKTYCREMIKACSFAVPDSKVAPVRQ